MSKAYKKAIDIVLTATPAQCRDMIISIAKSRPSAVVSAWGVDHPSKDTLGFISSVYAKDGKVAAVKEYRKLTGADLMVAKTYVEDECMRANTEPDLLAR